MSFKLKRFIVVTLTDTDSWGWNEQTLPILLQLVDLSAPDYRTFTNISVVANYLTSPRALKSVEDVIAKAEALRDTDSRFTTLGIGLAEGQLVAEFDWLGRIKTNRQSPMGGAVNDAVRVGRELQKYREILKTLRENVYRCAA